MFVNFEGIDGSGKSTIARLTAEHYGWEFFATPGPEYAPIRAAATKNIFSAFHYYVSSNYNVSIKISTKNIVSDRYIYSTLAYNWPFDTPIPVDPFPLFPQLAKPDVTVLLTATKETRIARMLHRKAMGGELTSLDMQFENQEKALEIYYKFNDLIAIDTSALSIDEVLHKVIKIIDDKLY